MIDYPVCSCDRCKSMCQRRPCWPTPEEALALINAGFSDRLMVDYWVGGRYPDPGDDEDECYNDILLLCPASKGEEGGMLGWSAAFGENPCCLQTEDGLCMLHDLGLKPLEGRAAFCKGTSSYIHKEIADMWNTPENQKIVDDWRNAR